jgi:hypothetical protein
MAVPLDYLFVSMQMAALAYVKCGRPDISTGESVVAAQQIVASNSLSPRETRRKFPLAFGAPLAGTAAAHLALIIGGS